VRGGCARLAQALSCWSVAILVFITLQLYGGRWIAAQPIPLTDTPKFVGTVRSAGTGLAEEVRPTAMAQTIGSISWDIKGRIQEGFVAATAHIETGKTFADKNALDAYLADRAQRLYNLRLFDEVIVECQDKGWNGTDAAHVIDIVVHLQESGTFVVLPGGSDDDVEGVILKANTLFFDFMGTGGELELGVSRAWPPESPGETSGSATLSFPFYIGLIECASSLESTPTIDDEGQSSMRATATLDAGLPLFDGAGRHQLILVPSVEVNGDWADTKSLSLSPGLGLQFGRIDWVQNRRRGYLFELTAIGTSTEGVGTGLSSLAPHYAADGSFHVLIGPNAELMGKVGLLWNPWGGDCGLGATVRGIDASRLSGDAGLYGNCDFWWNLGPFVFSKWLGMSWLRILDVEVHAGPFFDAAFARGSSGDAFGSAAGRLSAGLQVQSYALYAKPFYIYTAIGVDLRAALATGTVLGVAADGRPIAMLTSAVGIRY